MRRGNSRKRAVTCSMGVMPVPPAIMPSLVTLWTVTSSPVLMWISPRPLYVSFPLGPCTGMASPMAMLSRCLDMLPCGYTFTSSSKKPTSSSEVIGVYALAIGLLLIGAARYMCWPTGSPNMCSGDCSANRKMRVLWVSSCKGWHHDIMRVRVKK